MRFGLVAARSILAGLLVVASACAQADTAQMKPLRWILNGPALRFFSTDPVPLRFFAGAKPFVMQRKGDPVRLPASWEAQPTRSFSSYPAMKRAFGAGAIGPDVRAIIYDNEAWQFTPPEEQVHHASYARAAAELVHSHGLFFIATPGSNLARVLAPSAAASGEKRYDAFIRLRIAADEARYADAIDIQAQGSERDINKYAAFVRAAARQAREANPKVMVLAGISTNPGGQHVSADDILHAIGATRSAVDGYWFNVPQPSRYCPKCNDFRPDIAIGVLRRLSGRT